MQVSTASFDAENHDLSRPHKGEMAVAANLRLLLDGYMFSSTRITLMLSLNHID